MSSLARLIENLTVIRPRDSRALANVLATPVSFDDMRAFVRFDADNYVRTAVFCDERVELRLFGWRPGQSTSLHAHGDSACAFRVVRGAATEMVLDQRDRVWAPGSVVAEDGPLVHQVMNAGADPLLTLHAYSPPLPVDAPSSPDGYRIVIVGGGFSAAALAYHLLERGGKDLRINIVESGPWLGRGIAYGVESEIFRLNVPASKMSLDPDVPDDFVRFAGAQSEPNAFLSRSLYGRYVTARIANTIRTRPGKLRLFRDEAVSATDREVVLRSGRRLPADALILATGFTPRTNRAEWHPGVIDAWDECALATLPRHGRVLVVGTGLSALDVVAFLDAQSFDGAITLVSRHGLMPHAHESPYGGAPPLSASELARAPSELRPLVRWVREGLRATPDLPWQRAVDRLRPHVSSLYGALSPRDRARFARHVRPYWDIIRHRAPIDALARVHALEKAGRLERLAARVHLHASSGPTLRVEIQERSGARRMREFDAVVRCIGPSLYLAENATPLLQSLLQGGYARLTPEGLGIETLSDGRLVDASGKASHRILGIGAVRRASHWETTAAPDIAVQARQMAHLLL